VAVDLWQEYDEAENPLDTGGRSSHLGNPKRENGDTNFVAGVAIWLYKFGKQTDDNPTGIYILSQKRSQFVDANKGLWDVSAGGHIDVGETPLKAAVREAREEIGLTISESDLEEVFHNTIVEGLRHNYIYICRGSSKLEVSDFHFNDMEVEEVRWVPLSEFEEFIDKYAKPNVRNHRDERDIVHQRILENYRHQTADQK